VEGVDGRIIHDVEFPRQIAHVRLPNDALADLVDVFQRLPVVHEIHLPCDFGLKLPAQLPLVLERDHVGTPYAQRGTTGHHRDQKSGQNHGYDYRDVSNPHHLSCMAVEVRPLSTESGPHQTASQVGAITMPERRSLAASKTST